MSAADDRAVAVEGEPGVGLLLAGHARGEQVLAPVLDPLHGRPDVGRGQHDRHVLALHRDLLAEAAAGVAGDDADAVLGDAEQARAEQAPLVRGLRGGVDREVAAGGVRLDHEAAALHRHRGVALLADRLARHVGRAGERLVERVGAPAGDGADDVRAVRGVHQVVGVGGGRVVDDGGQRIDVDLDRDRRRPRRRSGSRRGRGPPGRRRSAPRRRRAAAGASRGPAGPSRCATARGRADRGRPP